MPDNALNLGGSPCEFVQIGVVVKDLDRTVKYLTEVFGLGPFRFITYPPADRDDMQLTYRGEARPFSHRLAFAQMGPIELELCQPLEGESGLTEFLREHGEGLQHIRFNTPQLQPALDYLAGKGVTQLMSGNGLRPGTQWVHLDTADQVGFVVEMMNVLPNTDGRTPQFVDGKVVETAS
jgi:methylmalonyl-CoA/ethylmalonyl-CoA epimerase